MEDGLLSPLSPLSAALDPDSILTEPIARELFQLYDQDENGAIE